MRQQLADTAGRVRAQLLERILELRIGVVSIEPRGVHQAHDRSGALARAQAAGEKPVAAPERDRSGPVLVHCFAGCSVADIVSAVGLDLGDLFPPRPVSDEHRPPRIRRPWRAADVLDALRIELMVVWVILADVAHAKTLTDGVRARAGVALDRCAALIQELNDAR